MRRHQPALLGGLFIGVLSSLPVLNYCCCLWVIVGGMLTAYLQQQRRTEPVEAGEAALGGLIAGLVGAVIALAVSAVLAQSVDVQQQLQSLFEEMQLPLEMRDRVSGLLDGPALLLLSAAIWLPVYAVFGLVGALLGSAIFRRRMPPSPPAAPPMSPEPPPTA
jgi:hypothetical protein